MTGLLWILIVPLELINTDLHPMHVIVTYVPVCKCIQTMWHSRFNKMHLLTSLYMQS